MRQFFALLALALLPLTLHAADVNGAWALSLNPDFGGTSDFGIPCTLRQAGEKLSVVCGEPSDQYPPAPMPGRVVGQQVTFETKTCEKDKFTATFTGTLEKQDTFINGTWELADAQGKRSGKFTLERKKR